MRGTIALSLLLLAAIPAVAADETIASGAGGSGGWIAARFSHSGPYRIELSVDTSAVSGDFAAGDYVYWPYIRGGGVSLDRYGAHASWTIAHEGIPPQSRSVAITSVGGIATGGTWSCTSTCGSWENKVVAVFVAGDFSTFTWTARGSGLSSVSVASGPEAFLYRAIDFDSDSRVGLDVREPIVSSVSHGEKVIEVEDRIVAFFSPAIGGGYSTPDRSGSGDTEFGTEVSQTPGEYRFSLADTDTSRHVVLVGAAIRTP